VIKGGRILGLIAGLVAAGSVVGLTQVGGTTSGVHLRTGNAPPASTPLQSPAGATTSGTTPSALTLPVAGAPNGPLGSAGNPLGSPGESLASCLAHQTAPVASISITITNTGFSSACYYAAANVPSSVQLIDRMTNAATGLTIPIEVAVATPSKPVVSQAATTASQAPGLTVDTSPVPIVQLSSAIYTSPTAPDTNPVDSVIPALAAGQYLLQLPTAPTVPAAVLTVSPVSAPPASSGVPTAASTTIADSTGVTVLAPSTSTEQALEVAFDGWERLPSTCPAKVIAGSARVAAVPGGVNWAMAQFQPASSCSYSLPPATPGGPARPIPPQMVGPFANTNGPPVGIFEQQSGGPWVMNEEGGEPFPCPAPEGIAPGPGDGALPAAVLAAWGLSYAPDCAFPSYPPQPR